MRSSSGLRASLIGLAVLALQAAVNDASAVPVSYSFSTGVRSGGQGNSCAGLPCAPHPYYAFSSTNTVSGTFVYDSAGPATTTAGDGSTIYGGFTFEGLPASSFAGLTGSVAGLSFSDLRGFTTVGNERLTILTGPGTSTSADIFQLTADPSLSSTSPHNFTGFDIGAYTLVNVRLFWIETQQIVGQSGPIPDLFSDQNLLAAPPTLLGKLALDFVPLGNTSTSTPTVAVFFDGLSVTPVAAIPEPETYAMLLAGLGLLGFAARRRKLKAATAA